MDFWYFISVQWYTTVMQHTKIKVQRTIRRRWFVSSWPLLIGEVNPLFFLVVESILWISTTAALRRTGHHDWSSLFAFLSTTRMRFAKRRRRWQCSLAQTRTKNERWMKLLLFDSTWIALGRGAPFAIPSLFPFRPFCCFAFDSVDCSLLIV